MMDRKPAGASVRDAAMVRDTFGGYTLEGLFEGAWVADDGRVDEESNYRLEDRLRLVRTYP